MLRAYAHAALAADLSVAPLALSQKNSNNSTLQDFYAVRLAVSDAAPFWFDYILEIVPAPEGVRVREFRIAPREDECFDAVTVKAVEREIPNSSAASLAGKADLCTLTDADVSHTIARYRGKKSEAMFESARFAVVAHCGSEERVYRFPYPEEVEFYDRLRRHEQAITRIWDLYFRVQGQVFGNREIFYGVSPERDAELQQQGAALVPDLRSGKFDAAFGKRLDSILQGYKGPVKEGSRAHVQLLNNADLPLTRYVSLPIPQWLASRGLKGWSNWLLM